MENNNFKSRTKEARKIYNANYYANVTKQKNEKSKLTDLCVYFSKIDGIEEIIRKYNNEPVDFILYLHNNEKINTEFIEKFTKFVIENGKIVEGKWLNFKCTTKMLNAIKNNK